MSLIPRGFVGAQTEFALHKQRIDDAIRNQRAYVEGLDEDERGVAAQVLAVLDLVNKGQVVAVPVGGFLSRECTTEPYHHELCAGLPCRCSCGHWGLA